MIIYYSLFIVIRHTQTRNERKNAKNMCSLRRIVVHLQLETVHVMVSEVQVEKTALQ